MKRYITLFLFLINVVFAYPQLYDPGIDNLINEVNQDSLMSYVRILSGEDSVYVDGQKQLIDQRVFDDNDLAADYLMEKLQGFGLSPSRLDYDVNGTNVVAVQQGTDFPETYFMICAHYDGVTYYCADDNASGTATVLEAARILSNIEFPYSIVYALWDEEEIGLLGSKDYAEKANTMGMDIQGVINIDMIAWDSNDDGLVEIHSNQNLNSGAVTNVMQQINSEYDLGLDPVVHNPGASASDHSSFWNYNYGAILLIEGYWSGDFNPYYHSVNDRVDKFNVPYFHQAARLAIGAVAELATQNQYVSISDLSPADDGYDLVCFPNPSSGMTTIQFGLPASSEVRIEVFNPFGQRVECIYDNHNSAGQHVIELDFSSYAKGLYTLILKSNQVQLSKKLVILK
jgi:hypothetical protein